MEQSTTFAKRLKDARIKAGMTQSDLAEKSGVTSASISAYESADGTKGKNPSLENARSIAESLGVSLDWLCGLSNENQCRENALQSTITLRDLLRYLVPLMECGICSVENVQTMLDEYNPYTEAMEKVNFESTKIEFTNYHIHSVLIGISKLIELKNSKLLPEATYRISADGIMERSKYIFMDLKSGNVSNATVFLDIPTDDSDDIFKL